MGQMDGVLSAFVIISLIVIATPVFIRWMQARGFWASIPSPSTQPVWATSPMVRSRLRIPNSKLAFLDIETEPSGRLWCIGVCEGEFVTSQFVAGDLVEERRILEEFVRYAQSRKDLVFCYYAGMRRFDEVVLRARLKAFGLPHEFFVMKDLFHTVRASLKIRRYGLKYVGARLGYRFRHWEIQGGMVPTLWRRSVRTHDSQLRQKLAEYNMDDAKALWYIVNWFEKNHPDNIRRERVRWRKANKLSPSIYEVPSFRIDTTYKVDVRENSCTCPVSRDCKHLQLVRELTAPELLASQ